MPVIPSPQEAKAGSLRPVLAKVSETLSQNKNTMARGIAQLAESLLSKHNTLHSIPNNKHTHTHTQNK
jgi:hypothetical protein